MKPIFKLLALVFLLLGMQPIKAQQNNLFNTYVYDPLQLNIAYAGMPCSEAILHYRKQWTGLNNAPTLLQLNAHTALGESNGIALRMSSQQAGLYNSMQATLGYAYRIKLSKTNSVNFGLGIGFVQNSLMAQKAVVVDIQDATLGNGGKQKAMGFDSELGIMFIGYQVKLGTAVQHLYASRADFSGSSYKAMPQFNTNISYTFNKDQTVEVEPWLVNMYTLKGNNTTEGLLNFNFMQTITVGAGYRSYYGVLFFLGIKTGSFKAGYSFDYGSFNNKAIARGSHQVMLGFSNCNVKAKKGRAGSRGRKIRSRF